VTQAAEAAGWDLGEPETPDAATDEDEERDDWP